MELIEIDLKSVGVFLSQCKTVGVSPQSVLTYLDDGYVVMAARTMQIDAIDETLPPHPISISN